MTEMKKRLPLLFFTKLVQSRSIVAQGSVTAMQVTKLDIKQVGGIEISSRKLAHPIFSLKSRNNTF